MIRAEKLVKKYGEKTVIDGLSFEITDGEKIVISGVSGSGKTTLARIIAGIEKADSGVICGYDVRDVSYMFQEHRLLPWERLIRNVTAPVGEEYADEAKKILTALGLGDDTDKYPHELSGGMKQRGALARALLYDKRILILDEPFSSLDAEMRAVCADLIKSRCGEKTVILISHQPEDAELLFGDYRTIAVGSAESESGSTI